MSPCCQTIPLLKVSAQVAGGHSSSCWYVLPQRLPWYIVIPHLLPCCSESVSRRHGCPLATRGANGGGWRGRGGGERGEGRAKNH